MRDVFFEIMLLITIHFFFISFFPFFPSLLTTFHEQSSRYMADFKISFSNRRHGVTVSSGLCPLCSARRHA